MILLCVVLAAAGCGREPRRVAVEGAVNYTGSQVQNGLIVFEPDGVPNGQSSGGPVTGGRYNLGNTAGLLPGKYKVRITATDPNVKPSEVKLDPDGTPVGGGAPKQLLPPRYNQNTELVRDITPGEPNVIDFDLK